MGAANPPLELGEGGRRVGVTSFRWQRGRGTGDGESCALTVKVLTQLKSAQTKVQVMYLERK